MQKMSRQDFLDLFPIPEPSTVDVNKESKATQKRHKHQHNPSAKPSVVMGKFFPVQTPAQWRRNHIAKGH